MFFYQRITPAVKALLVVNVAIYLVQVISSITIANNFLEFNFALHYLSVLYEYKFWQIFTYMFLHGGLWHLLFNMLALYFLGSEIEREWGTKHFLRYYLATGVGAGIIIFLFDSAIVLINPALISNLGYTLGASGAIFGLLLAYSLLFSERRITLLLFFILPVNIKAKNLLLLSLGISFLFPLLFAGMRISNIGHVGGVLSGFLYFFFYRKNQTYFYCIYAIKEGWEKFKKLLFPAKIKKVDPTSGGVKFNRNFSYSEKIDETKMSSYEIEEKIDQLLDKISLRGLKGLTEEEKKFLERVSHLYKHKFPK